MGMMASEEFLMELDGGGEERKGFGDKDRLTYLGHPLSTLSLAIICFTILRLRTCAGTFKFSQPCEGLRLLHCANGPQRITWRGWFSAFSDRILYLLGFFCDVDVDSCQLRFLSSWMALQSSSKNAFLFKYKKIYFTYVDSE